MSFNNLTGQTVSDNNGNIYIISDSFSVIFPGEQEPLVYEWGDVSAVRINDESLIITCGDNTYTLAPDFFESRKHYLSVSTLARVNAVKAGISCVTTSGLLPDKAMYIGADIPDNAVFATGEYSIKDIKSSLLLLLIGKTTRILWTAGIVGGLLALLLFNIFIGFNETNWWYLLIGGFFCGVGCVALLYIIFMIIAKLHYSFIFRSYQKHNDTVTFAVCNEGFSACESDVYTPTELIRWNSSDTYIETGTMFIVTRRKNPILWIPKSLFTVDQHKRIADILAINLSEK